MTKAVVLVPTPQTINGNETDSDIFDHMKNGRPYEPWIVDLLPDVVSRDSVVLDVGANIGYMTLVLAALCPEGRVHAFEPFPANFALLSETREDNALGNVRLHKVGLTDREGEAFIVSASPEGGNALIYYPDMDRALLDGAGFSAPVGMTTLDGWAERQGLDRLDLIKVDIEGSEPRFLAGAKRTLARFRPDMVVEFNIRGLAQTGFVPQAVLAQLLCFYPFVFRIDRATHRLARIVSEDQIAELEASGIEDLYCTFDASRCARRIAPHPPVAPQELHELEAMLAAERQNRAVLEEALAAERRGRAVLEETLGLERQNKAALKEMLELERQRKAIAEETLDWERQSRAKLEQALDQERQAKARLEAALASTSWRVTAPLRRIKQALFR